MCHFSSYYKKIIDDNYNKRLINNTGCLINSCRIMSQPISADQPVILLETIRSAEIIVVSRDLLTMGILI